MAKESNEIVKEHYPCCGVPKSGGHRGTCKNSMMNAGWVRNVPITPEEEAELRNPDNWEEEGWVQEPQGLTNSELRSLRRNLDKGDPENKGKISGKDRTGRKPVEEIPGIEILRVQVGSRAHGTHTDKSDNDARLVFVLPLKDICVIGNKPKETVWKIDGKDDVTGWELAHFLKLATQCNPTVLEVLWAPVLQIAPLGDELRALRNSILNKKRIMDAFSGYAHNQQKKMLDGGGTWGPNNWKFATAYLRVLHQGIELLKTGELPVDMSQDKETLYMLMDTRQGKSTAGDVIDDARKLQVELQSAYQRSTVQDDADLSEVNEFLLRARVASLI